MPNNFVANLTEMSRENQRPCRRCGDAGPHAVAAGKGPHAAQLVCRGCGAHIMWLSRRSADERAAVRGQHRDAHLSSLPPTPRQIAYLSALGHAGASPANRLEASRASAQRLGEMEAQR